MTACARWAWASWSNMPGSAARRNGRNLSRAVGITRSLARMRSTPEPDHRFNLVFEKIPGGHGGFNRWTINGKSWPDVDPLIVKAGQRYRIAMDNKSGDDHPVHFHRHTFELTRIGGKTTSGIRKDTVNVPRRQAPRLTLSPTIPALLCIIATCSCTWILVSWRL